MTAESGRTLGAAMVDFIHAGTSAIMFAVEPESWPAFAAWAGQRLPGETFTEEDRAVFTSLAALGAAILLAGPPAGDDR